MSQFVTVRINQGSEQVIFIPVDPSTPITGWSVKSQARPGPGSAYVLAEWSTAAGTAVISGDGIRLLIPAATSSVWTWTQAAWDVEATDPNGNTVRVVQGTLVLSQEVTR